MQSEFRREYRKYHTIPVFVDSVKKVSIKKDEKEEELGITRLVSYSIDYEEDQMYWDLILKELSIQYIMVGPYPILYKPMNHLYFKTTNDIIELFNQIEKNGFFVETKFIFLPTEIFTKTPKRGDIYRIDSELFKGGFKLTRDKITLDDLNNIRSDIKRPMKFSRAETHVFRNWGKIVNEKLRTKHKEIQEKEGWDEYHKKYLRWDETKERGLNE